MDRVFVIGVGYTKIDRFYEKTAKDLFQEALTKAVEDAGGLKPRALVLGNMTSSTLMEQDSLAALMVDYSGLRGAPAFKVEAACGSGGAAAYVGYSLVKSGVVDAVAVAGVEKLTEGTTAEATRALAQAADADYELFYGVSFTGLNALLARMYMNKFGYTRRDLAHWSVRMHEYASYNPYAQIPRKTTIETVLNSPVIADPIHLFDCAPIGDGAAVAILVRGEEKAREFSRKTGRDVLVELAGVGFATDSVDIASRADLYSLPSTRFATEEACSRAKVELKQIDYVEVHDAFTITGFVSLESMGFANKGESVKLWVEGRFGKGDKPEVNFSGGLKARGHPVGATGVYQLIEAVTQIRGDFPGFKASDPNVAALQNIGGVGTFSIVSIVRRFR